jgi:hypothetical protein
MLRVGVSGLFKAFVVSELLWFSASSAVQQRFSAAC